MRLTPLLAVMCATSIASAQDKKNGGATTASPAPDEPPQLGEPAKPPDGAPPHLQLIDRNDLAKHAYWLASDERNGRYTSSTGQRATAKYVADRFKALGLRPLGDKRGYLQEYPLASVRIGKKTELSFGRTKVREGYTILPSADEESVALRGKFAYCGNGTGDAMPKLKGRIPVVVLQGLVTGNAPGNRLQAIGRFVDLSRRLQRKGASAVVVCLLDDATGLSDALNSYALQPDHPKLQYGSSRRRSAQARVPLFILNRKTSLGLLDHIGSALDQDGKPQEPDSKKTSKGSLRIVVEEDDTSASNVVAVLDGSDKKAEAVVISAHHDHIGERVDGDVFNGADDNASGTAGLLEIAEAFAKGGPAPSRSVIFLSVSGEELGLWGSEHFADNPTWPVKRIIANVNIDMIGRAGGTPERPQMRITPSYAHQKYSTIVRDAVELGGKFGIQFTSGDTYYQRSDHYNFAKKGIPVVFFCDGEHPDYHQVTDHADKLGYAAMESVARLAFWTAWNVADADARPQDLGRQKGW